MIQKIDAAFADGERLIFEMMYGASGKMNPDDMIVPIANLEIHFFRGELYHTINCLYFQIAERQIFHSFRFYRNYYIIKFEFCKFLFPYFK